MTYLARILAITLGFILMFTSPVLGQILTSFKFSAEQYALMGLVQFISGFIITAMQVIYLSDGE